MKRASLLILFVIATVAAKAQPSSKTIALVNARIVTVTNGTIERGTIVMRDGTITALGADVSAPGGAEVIDCSGLSIYPGLIDAGTRLGLIEIGSIPETRDADEMGDLTPHAQALTAVNPNSEAIPVTRTNGVATVVTMPSGGLLPGTAALIALHGYTPQQMSVDGRRFLVMNFPSGTRGGWWDDRSDEEIEKKRKESYEKLDEMWDRATLFAKIDSASSGASTNDPLPDYSPLLDAMIPAVRGEMPVLIEVDKASDIDSALAWIERRKLDAILTGVSEGWRVADKIAAADIPCIVGPVITIPARESDRYDKAYANIGLLSKAGVRVAIRTNDVENVRNLPFNAGFAIAYGMDRDAALRAVTITSAEILGVGDLLGSLEVGKQATLFVADGDPFETATTVRRLFIRGWDVPLVSRHTDLYEEFLQRSP